MVNWRRILVLPFFLLGALFEIAMEAMVAGSESVRNTKWDMRIKPKDRAYWRVPDDN